MSKGPVKFKGSFITSSVGIKKKLAGIKAFVFDWDGVFNNGQKFAESGSPFSEVDSMGTNLLRYSLYLKHKEIPYTAIISGEKNAPALYFSKRECFHSSYFKFPDKKIAFAHFCEAKRLKPEEVAFCFDDVLDLPIAEKCGLRILIDQKANVNFRNHCVKFKYADYITHHSGGEYAVREACELLIGLNGNFDEVIHTRKDYTEGYFAYIQKRRSVVTQFFTPEHSGVKQVDPE